MRAFSPKPKRFQRSTRERCGWAVEGMLEVAIYASNRKASIGSRRAALRAG
jgi:hypothetical protein